MVGHVSDDGKTVYDKNWNTSKHISDDGKTTHDKDWNVSGHNTKGSGCFITTACVKYAGMSDDCFELTIIRRFRDNYIHNLPNGNQLLEDYYKIAPLILKNILSSAEVNKVLSSLREKVKLVVHLIQNNKHSEVMAIYDITLSELRDKYGETTENKGPAKKQTRNIDRL